MEKYTKKQALANKKRLQQIMNKRKRGEPITGIDKLFLI